MVNKHQEIHLGIKHSSQECEPCPVKNVCSITMVSVPVSSDGIPEKQNMKKHKHPFPVCKPCWEINYCPYGHLVEFFPLPTNDVTIEEIELKYNETFNELKTGSIDNDYKFWETIQRLEYLNPRRWVETFKYDYSELVCNVYGHICPVFFTAEKFTETEKTRDTSKKRYIPREVMLKVTRRDGQVCQECAKNVLDNELHFDHIIPLRKGGPTNVENLRVLCAKCNLNKSDSTESI